MSKHTPGPWRFCGCGHCQLVWGADGETLIHEDVYEEDCRTAEGEEAQSNARLIAAAPELLEVLEVVEDSPSAALAMFQGEGFVFDGSGGRWEKLAFSLYAHIVDLGEKARAAIAKAEGE